MPARAARVPAARPSAAIPPTSRPVLVALSVLTGAVVTVSSRSARTRTVAPLGVPGFTRAAPVRTTPSVSVRRTCAGRFAQCVRRTLCGHDSDSSNQPVVHHHLLPPSNGGGSGYRAESPCRAGFGPGPPSPAGSVSAGRSPVGRIRGWDGGRRRASRAYHEGADRGVSALDDGFEACTAVSGQLRT